MLLGCSSPISGGGTILGCDIRRSSSELRGRVGYMPEAAAIVPMLKGVEFVAFAGDMYGMPHRDAKRRAHEVLNYVGLGELRYRRLEEYSTGNLQRLKLAAALVHDPQLLLLDEPTNGLDPAGRIAMLQLLEDLIAETGKSVILCTHLLGDVERLCQQIVVLDRGTVVRAGTMDEMRAQVSNRYELTWCGRRPRFALHWRRPASLCRPTSHGQTKVMVTIPEDFTTDAFFELAHGRSVDATELKADEENLERLFFRVTGQEAPAPARLAPARFILSPRRIALPTHGPRSGPLSRLARPAAIAVGGVHGDRARGAGAGVAQQGLLAGAGAGRPAVPGVLEHHLRRDATLAAGRHARRCF